MTGALVLRRFASQGLPAGAQLASVEIFQELCEFLHLASDIFC